jgi:leishmanolysin
LDTSYLDYDAYACTAASNKTLDNWQCIQSTDVLTPAKREFLEGTILPQAVHWLGMAYAVRRIVGKLTMTATDCSANTKLLAVPVNYRTSGVAETDLLLFVTARPGVTSVLAYAAACETDNHGRPIAGHINFNPYWLRPNIAEDALVYRIQEIVQTAIHEIHHVLGFDRTAMNRFLDPDTNVLRPAGWVLTSMATARTTVTAVKTPNLLAMARQYFDCPTLEGLPLEDGGGAGTEGNHWEKRVMMNEFMTGSISTNPSLSKFTMAFMQDSGWYVANMSVAPDLIWGKGKGCQFVKGTCVPTNVGEYFCDQESAYGCTFDRINQAQCVITDYSSALPAKYQNFDTAPTKGGQDALADYCPYYLPVYNGDCRYGETVIEGGYDFGFLHSTESACFGSTLVWGNNIRDFSGGCYRFRCVGPDLLKVWIHSVWYTCKWGAIITAIGFNGTLVCPSKDEGFCSRQTNTTDATWPTMLDINPREGGAGTVITITGKNFASPMCVNVGGYNATNVVVVNSETITATLAEIPADISILLASETITYVLITDARGYTDVTMGAFVLKQDLISNKALTGIIAWIKANVLLVVLIAVALLAVIGIATFILIRHRNAVKQRIQDEAIAAEKKAEEDAAKKEKRRKARAKAKKKPDPGEGGGEK